MASVAKMLVFKELEKLFMLKTDWYVRRHVVDDEQY